MGSAGAPERIIVGRIATLAGKSGFGWIDAIAIEGGRILATGSVADMAALAGPRTETWRLTPDLCILPGITDAHLHLTDAAISAQELSLESAPDRGSIEAAIASEHERLTDGGDRKGWLLGQGWSIDRWGGWPSAADLDALAPSRPAVLWSHDHHSSWGSSRAFALAGIGPDTPDPEGGLIRRGADGRPTGILHEHAIKLLTPAIPQPTDAWIVKALQAYSADLLARGVVAVHDPCEMEVGEGVLRGPVLYAALAAEGRLTLRVAGSIRGQQIGHALELGLRSGANPAAVDRADGRSVRAAHRARVGWLKLFADGALGSRSAALLEPYEAEPGRRPVGGPRGMLLEPAESLRAHAERAAGAGIAVQIHAIGDAAVRSALDVLAGLPRHPEGVMHRVEHAQLVAATDIDRFASLGVAASVQASHLASDRDMVLSAWGDRSGHAFPLASLAAAGATLAMGTDAPVESPDPWPGIAIAVTRCSPRWADGRPFHAEQSIDLARALRAACVEPALVAGELDRGRLVAGHRADLVVIQAEAVDEPPRPGGALESARPLATLIDGDVAYRSSAFDP